MPPDAWSWSAEALVPVALAAVYLTATRRSRRPWRTAASVAGCGLLVAVLVTPLDTLAREYLVWAHLLQNVVLAEWAPLLLVLGIPPDLAGRLSRRRAVALLTHPLVALPLWVATYAAWHVPALYDAALRHQHSLLPLEHATYVVSGILFWWCVWQDAPHRLSSPARAGYVFAAFLLSAPLGLVLALVPSPLYEFYADAAERVWGLSRLEDQQLGGMTMAGEQSIVFFVVFALWFTRFLSEQERLEEVA
ncbi:MAG TPA: cytochrome c oxidase assembly protein [Gaiella sp.]|uniref:cytochrome c oxidase assembly protein n=1 Tax=Gaiella sp. TaxID=2663207 RepID=UPI002D80B5DC|nr:cytochrome c oxidase assembly protein [Gaiella sp.]HET9288203.1 cytochrome c oxidase assembly protein [Gaiella sp.]